MGVGRRASLGREADTDAEDEEEATEEALRDGLVGTAIRAGEAGRPRVGKSGVIKAAGENLVALLPLTTGISSSNESTIDTSGVLMTGVCCMEPLRLEKVLLTEPLRESMGGDMATELPHEEELAEEIVLFVDEDDVRRCMSEGGTGE